MNLTGSEIRDKFLKFFESKGHKVIPSASLVPENDPSVLFNTAGMQPLVPYLLGQKHPMGTRLCNAQKCVRTGDIDEVGDNRHLTFFEMLGNWSLGDYFKEDAIAWSYEFLISKEWLGLDKDRLYVTVFEGNDDAPRDEEAAKIWEKYLPKNRIYFLSEKNNWWSAGENGPCGPDTEIFYDTNEVALGNMTHDEFVKADEEGKVIEIWNNVFMEYERKEGKVIGKLAQHNVDTGIGLERITMVSQGVKTVFDTDLFKPILEEIKRIAGDSYDEYSARIIADHIKSASILIADGVLPGNKDQGYVLRRLIRRAIIRAQKMNFFEQFDVSKNNDLNKNEIFLDLLNIIFNIYSRENGVTYFTKEEQPFSEPETQVMIQISLEVGKFRQTLEKGLKEFEKGVDPFVLFTTYGFPIELTEELAKEKGQTIDLKDFEIKLKEHQELSRTASAGMFKGGLADAGEETKRLHTATHLLNAALRQVLGNHVMQKGSNITPERLRFDFSHTSKLTDEEIKKVEDIINDIISENLPVNYIELPKNEAEKIAVHSFNEKYGDIVKVYFVGDNPSISAGRTFSAEFCGGPHVSKTGELGFFKIIKEEAVSAGVRRIKAILE